ncbi:MAG: hypothetical protein ACOCQQ_00725 [Candidatus Nanoarchaeia archaeon]
MARKKFISKQSKQKALVDDHITATFALANKKRYSDPGLSSRLHKQIRLLTQKFRHTLPREIKRSYCPSCKRPFTFGKDTRVRVRRGKVIYYCTHCNSYVRYPYKHK